MTKWDIVFGVTVGIGIYRLGETIGSFVWKVIEIYISIPSSKGDKE